MRKYDIPPFIFSFKNDTFEVFSFFFIKYGLISGKFSYYGAQYKMWHE